MTKRDANQMLMAHWARSWTTLGRWQELNSRLSRDAAAPTSGWMRLPTGVPRAALQRPAGGRFGEIGASE